MNNTTGAAFLQRLLVQTEYALTVSSKQFIYSEYPLTKLADFHQQRLEVLHLTRKSNWWAWHISFCTQAPCRQPKLTKVQAASLKCL
ncbi:Acyl-CoA-binding protein [Trichinella pseudospiralis]